MLKPPFVGSRWQDATLSSLFPLDDPAATPSHKLDGGGKVEQVSIRCECGKEFSAKADDRFGAFVLAARRRAACREDYPRLHIATPVDPFMNRFAELARRDGLVSA